MTTIYTRPEREVFGHVPGYSYAGNLVHTATGNFVWQQVDLHMADPLLSWHTTYNSRGRDEGRLGPGWAYAHGARLFPHRDEERDAGTSGGGEPGGPHRDDVRLHDGTGRVLTFRRRDRDSFERPQDIDADLVPTDDGFALRFFHGEHWIFDESGRLREKRDEGRVVTLEHDGDRITRVVHSAGQWIALEYDGDRITEVSADDGRRVAYAYDNGLLRTVDGPGGTTTYDHDPDRRITRVTDADDVIAVVNGYDQGRVVRQESAGAGALDFAYADDGQTTVTHTPSGAVSTYRHNVDYRATEVIDALGNTATMDYAADGRLIGASLPGGAVLERSYVDGNLVSFSYAGATTRYEYDDHRRLIKVVDTANDVTTYTYEGDSRIPTTTTGPDGETSRTEVRDGLVVARSDSDGTVVRYLYDERRNLVGVVDADGQRTTFERDAAGRRTKTVAPTGDAVSVEYDAAGRPTKVVDQDGAVTTTEYSAAGRLRGYTDAEGATTSLDYDADGRLVARTDREGLVTRFEYDESGLPSALVQPNGVRVETGFDALGRIERVDEADVGTTTFEYDAYGHQTAVHAPSGTTTSTFDLRGNLTSVTQPGGATTTYSYDPRDRVIDRVDPSGAHWGTTFDSRARTVTHTDPDGARRTTILDGTGRGTTSIDPLGRRTEYRYDRNGNLVEITDPQGGRTRFARDALGRAVARTTPAGLTTRYDYRDNRLVAVTDPRGWVTRFEHDRNGRRTKVITPTGATTTYAYSRRGALTRVTDPRGGVTTYAYDEAGNLTRLVDAKGVTTEYAYDRAGRRIEITDPLGRTTRRAFDDRGRLASIHNPAGDVLRFAYGDAGRLVRRWTDDGDEVTYTYDGAGRRTAMTDSTGTTSYTYDAAGRLTSATWPGDDTFTWTYDAAGQLRELTHPDQASVRYRYNPNGQLIALTDSQAGEAVYALDPDGRLVTEQLPGGWSRRYAYDGGLLVAFTETRAGITAQRTALERDGEGRVTRQEDLGGTRGFAYDPAGQLVTVDQTAMGRTTRTHYGYDIVGNRTTSVADDIATRYLYDPADQLVAIESPGRRIGYTHDGAGRLVLAADGDIRQCTTYDGFGHPTATVTSRAWAVERTESQYNGDGYLVRWQGRTGDDSAPHTEVCYRWSTGDVLPQILHQHVDTHVPQSDNTAPLGRDLATARFTYGYTRTFATTAHDSVTFARDVHGSAVATESTLPWVRGADYDSFGVPAGQGILPGPSSRARIPTFGYRGELAFGPVLNLRARHYDTTLGRFTTRDPVSLVGGGTLANHPYAYAHGDPLDQVDPKGTWPIFVQSIADMIASILRQAATGCADCQNPGNGIESHRKCFQGRACLYTRGSFNDAELNAEHDALRSLWHSGRREAVGQALAIFELNGRRQGFWDRRWENLGFDRAISPHVDWEVGTRGNQPPPRFRVDIMADEENIFEVKQWKNGSAYWEVEQQLDRYLLFGANLNLLFFKGKELEDWADSVDVITGLHWPWSEEIVYVWGLNNPAGHIYVAKDDDDNRLNDDMKGKADEKRESREFGREGFPIIPIIPVPVPIPV